MGSVKRVPSNSYPSPDVLLAALPETLPPTGCKTGKTSGGSRESVKGLWTMANIRVKDRTVFSLLECRNADRIWQFVGRLTATWLDHSPGGPPSIESTTKVACGVMTAETVSARRAGSFSAVNYMPKVLILDTTKFVPPPGHESEDIPGGISQSDIMRMLCKGALSCLFYEPEEH